MKPVFLDTVGLLAVWDEDDQWHTAASRAYAQLIEEKCIFVTTSYVLAECGNAASRRSFRRNVVALRDQLEARERVLFPTEEEWKHAWKAYASNAPGDPGLVDQLSFVVMRNYGLTRAFTNDRHFSGAGFQTLF